MVRFPFRRGANRPRALIVDRDEQFAKEISIYLEQEYEVIVQADSEGALRTVKEQGVDLVVLELLLPPFRSRGGAEEGLALIRLLQEEHHLLVVVITQLEDDSCLAEARRAGALAVESKQGLTPERLLACLGVVQRGGRTQGSGFSTDDGSRVG